MKKSQFISLSIRLVACLAVAASVIACGQDRDAGQVVSPVPDVRPAASTPTPRTDGHSPTDPRDYADTLSHFRADRHADAHADSDSYTCLRPRTYTLTHTAAQCHANTSTYTDGHPDADGLIHAITFTYAGTDSDV